MEVWKTSLKKGSTAVPGQNENKHVHATERIPLVCGAGASMARPTQLTKGGRNTFLTFVRYFGSTVPVIGGFDFCEYRVTSFVCLSESLGAEQSTPVGR